MVAESSVAGANLTQADLRGALYDVDECLKLGFLKVCSAIQCYTVPYSARTCVLFLSMFLDSKMLFSSRSTLPGSRWIVGQDAKIGAVDWAGKDLSNAQMPGCDLQGSTLTRCIATGINLEGANLRSACLDGTDMTNANLKHTILLNCSLAECTMKDTDLRDATYDVEAYAKKGWLVAAKIGQVDWRGKNLSGCDLSQVNIAGANLKSCFLTNTQLIDAVLNNCNLSYCNLEGAAMNGASCLMGNFEQVCCHCLHAAHQPVCCC